MKKGTLNNRMIYAKESFAAVGECIGEITHDKRLFAVTRGQWSMIDAVRYCLSVVGSANISLWTWTVAEYEVKVLEGLMHDANIKSATLIIDAGSRIRNKGLLKMWRGIFGDDSIKFVSNHAKIATIETNDYKLLLRGSMNLNFNPRFEQFDLSEGCDGFEIVRSIEESLPVLHDDCSRQDIINSSKIDKCFDACQMSLFDGAKVFAK